MHLHPDGSIDRGRVVAFLRDLLGHLRGPVIVIWDRLAAHRGAQVRRYVQRTAGLHLEWLPPYAGIMHLTKHAPR